MDTMLLVEMAALLLAIGAFAGVLAGLLGVGGGIVLVPAFYYAFVALGFDGPDVMRLCLGTSLATIIVTSVRSVLSHNRKGAVDWGILRSWTVGIVVGSVLGVLLVSQLATGALQAIFGILAIVVGVYMMLGRNHWRLGDGMPTGLPRVILSPLLGFLSVLMGIGGGSFGVPVMSLYGVPIHRAVATAAGFGVIIAVPSVAGFLLTPMRDAPPFTFGSVNGIAFLLVIAMTLITAPMGAALAHRIDAKPLKRVFGGFLIIVALNMLRKVLI
ncbi:sulfite exporter TauE/SafE family protein [Loktanella sp. SALINAS62]|uniref:sulfite exporter TauE/SafE family protein n=1 Tax=Loktanella sp. SALINAS62 TaxID=2706124 RepID=UPI001B8B7318|nr:sulfite exporter TauE/SafE family protein [Loktanella sp. SALINAS62]MBS1301543.1 sulfite exporter TauE/SafE family protein [Loktanella sp. SALINAS62]